MKLLNARVNNLESNLHIEIDMERIEDRSKALSYIGIEVADALKSIPTPVEEVEQNIVEEVAVQEAETVQGQLAAQEQYMQETTFEAKPTLWQKIKNSKVGRPAGTSNLNLIFVIYLIALPTLLFLIFCHNVGCCY